MLAHERARCLRHRPGPATTNCAHSSHMCPPTPRCHNCVPCACMSMPCPRTPTPRCRAPYTVPRSGPPEPGPGPCTQHIRHQPCISLCACSAGPNTSHSCIYPKTSHALPAFVPPHCCHSQMPSMLHTNSSPLFLLHPMHPTDGTFVCPAPVLTPHPPISQPAQGTQGYA